MKYRVRVDREKCIACGVAPSLCPDVFFQEGAEFKNRVKAEFEIEGDDRVSIGVVPEELYECVKSAADSCPVEAISVEPVEE